jgi:hypothetical protein
LFRLLHPLINGVSSGRRSTGKFIVSYAWDYTGFGEGNAAHGDGAESARSGNRLPS